jgi:hypothetical protein
MKSNLSIVVRSSVNYPWAGIYKISYERKNMILILKNINIYVTVSLVLSFISYIFLFTLSIMIIYILFHLRETLKWMFVSIFLDLFSNNFMTIYGFLSISQYP